MNVTSQELETFVLKNQENLETIKRSFNEFNIFNVLGIQHREIRHSNFLGWLFDPNESHQLDDIFLRDLFKLMGEVGVLNGNDLVSFLLKDLSNTQVYRESVHNIDILIVNETLGFVICIENKIYADYSDHQLEKYFTYVEENYQWCKRYYLTLTPFRNENHKNYEAGDNYTNTSYGDIVELLKQQKTSINNAIPTVRESITQYITMCEKSVTQSGDEVRLSKRIYKKYKKEIEFIIKNKPNFRTEKDLLISKFKEHKISNYTIINNVSHPKIIRFLPENKDLIGLFTDDRFNSWESDIIFCLELFVDENQIWVKWCFGNIAADHPNNELYNKRAEMINTMKDFDCFKSADFKFIKHSADVDGSYPGIGAVSLFWENTFFNQDLDFFDFFMKKMNELDSKLIQPWVKECLQKL